MIACTLIGVGFGPLLYWHVVGMLERPHYQFLLLLPVAAPVLIGATRASGPSRRRARGGSS